MPNVKLFFPWVKLMNDILRDNTFESESSKKHSKIFFHD